MKTSTKNHATNSAPIQQATTGLAREQVPPVASQAQSEVESLRSQLAALSGAARRPMQGHSQYGDAQSGDAQNGEAQNAGPNHVKKLREDLLMSKAELARKAGLSALTIDRVESGMPCRMDTKRKIILALGLQLQDKKQVFEN